MRRVVAALASVWVAATARAGPARESPVVEASRAAAAIVVDGRLDEPAWASAGVIPDLVPEGRFIDRLWQLRGLFSATPDLILSTDLQFDSGSRNLGANVRLRWTIRPGREVYVVWNRGWREPGEETRRLLPVAEQVVAKLRWTFRP